MPCMMPAGWLEQRLEQVYSQDPGYSSKAQTLFTLDLQPPATLPDNLRGEQWNFVQLPLSALQQELQQVQSVSPNGSHNLQSSVAVPAACRRKLSSVHTHAKICLNSIGSSASWLILCSHAATRIEDHGADICVLCRCSAKSLETCLILRPRGFQI